MVLRRQPAPIIMGRPEGGYTRAFEIICSRASADPRTLPDDGRGYRIREALRAAPETPADLLATPRYLGVKIPLANLRPDFLKQAQVSANKLADSLYARRR